MPPSIPRCYIPLHARSSAKDVCGAFWCFRFSEISPTVCMKKPHFSQAQLGCSCRFPSAQPLSPLCADSTLAMGPGVLPTLLCWQHPVLRAPPIAPSHLLGAELLSLLEVVFFLEAPSSFICSCASCTSGPPLPSAKDSGCCRGQENWERIMCVVKLYLYSLWKWRRDAGHWWSSSKYAMVHQWFKTTVKELPEWATTAIEQI